MSHGVLRRDPFRMVVPQHQTQQVKRLLRNQGIVLRVNEFGPGLAGDWLWREEVLVVCVEDEAVLVEVGVELLSSRAIWLSSPTGRRCHCPGRRARA